MALGIDGRAGFNAKPNWSDAVLGWLRRRRDSGRPVWLLYATNGITMFTDLVDDVRTADIAAKMGAAAFSQVREAEAFISNNVRPENQYFSS